MTQSFTRPLHLWRTRGSSWPNACWGLRLARGSICSCHMFLCSGCLFLCSWLAQSHCALRSFAQLLPSPLPPQICPYQRTSMNLCDSKACVTAARNVVMDVRGASVYGDCSADTDFQLNICQNDWLVKSHFVIPGLNLTVFRCHLETSRNQDEVFGTESCPLPVLGTPNTATFAPEPKAARARHVIVFSSHCYALGRRRWLLIFHSSCFAV